MLIDAYLNFDDVIKYELGSDPFEGNRMYNQQPDIEF